MKKPFSVLCCLLLSAGIVLEAQVSPPSPDNSPAAPSRGIPHEGGAVVYAVNTYGWRTMYAYVWDAYGVYKECPGEAMTLTPNRVNGLEVYSYTFPEQYTHVLFSDGSAQTEDLMPDSTGQYWYDGRWYASLHAIPATDIETPEPEFCLTGDFNDWDEADAPRFRFDTLHHLYTVTIDRMYGAFKVNTAQDWDRDNYGAVRDGVVLATGGLCTLQSRYHRGGNYSLRVTGAYRQATFTLRASPEGLMLTFVSGTPDLLYSFNAADRTASVIRAFPPQDWQSGYAKGAVVVPDTVERNGVVYAVTGIDDFAFHDCTAMTSVVVGDRVTSIGDFAFHNCPALTTVTIGRNVAHIGAAFTGDCKGLTSVIWRSDKYEDGYEGYGHGDRYDKDDFEEDPEGTDYRLKTPFQFEVNYQLADYEHEYEYIAEYGLKCELYDENNVCISEVNDLDDPHYETHCLYYNYEHNISPQITSFVFEGDMTMVPAFACFALDKVRSVSLPEKVIAIGAMAFCGCSALKTLVLPDRILSVGSYAFAGCQAWKDVRVPASLTFLGAGAYSNTRLAVLDLPASLNRVPEDAFYNCRQLHHITLHDRVTHLHQDAFSECGALEQIVVHAPAPPTFVSYISTGCEEPSGGEEATEDVHPAEDEDSASEPAGDGNKEESPFAEVPRGGNGPTVFVPLASVGLYETSEIWKDFNILPAESVRDPYLRVWADTKNNHTLSRSYSSVAAVIEDAACVVVEGHNLNGFLQAGIHACSGVFSIDSVKPFDANGRASVYVHYRLERTDLHVTDTLVLNASGIERRMLLKLSGYITAHAGTAEDPLTIDELQILQKRALNRTLATRHHTSCGNQHQSLVPDKLYVRGVVKEESLPVWNDENKYVSYVSFALGDDGCGGNSLLCDLALANSIPLTEGDILPFDTVTLRLNGVSGKNPSHTRFATNATKYYDILDIVDVSPPVWMK